MISGKRIGPISSLLTVVLLLRACGEGGVVPETVSREDVTRAFSAIEFTTTTDGTTTDQLSEGATLDITLHEDGTTTGNLFIPGGGEDGGDLDADLTGTFSFDESTDQVTFDHSAETFIRDMTFMAVRSSGAIQLEGEKTLSGTVVAVVLK